MNNTSYNASPPLPEPSSRDYFYVFVMAGERFACGHGTFTTDASVPPSDICLMIRALLKDDTAYVALYDQCRQGGKQGRWVVNPGESCAREYPIESASDVESVARQFTAQLAAMNPEPGAPCTPPRPLYEHGLSLN